MTAGSDAPLLLCANHLTWIDSVLIQWALFSPWRVALSYRLLVWNLPERSNFYRNPWLRAYCYLSKCLPIVRGGDRDEQNLVASKVNHLLAEGELVMIFPEGGRSRSGRVEVNDFAYGVGRLVKSLPGCRVLCVYMRGREQQRPSVLPASGQVFDLEMDVMKPRSAAKGLRATRELASSIVERLAQMEGAYFADRQ